VTPTTKRITGVDQHDRVRRPAAHNRVGPARQVPAKPLAGSYRNRPRNRAREAMRRVGRKHRVFLLVQQVVVLNTGVFRRVQEAVGLVAHVTQQFGEDNRKPNPSARPAHGSAGWPAGR